MTAKFEYAWGYQGNNMNLPVTDVDKAVAFYENMMGFHIVSRDDSPHRSVTLGRDGIQIRLAENGGDSSQDGCFFQVDNVEDAFAELKENGLQKEASNALSIEDQGGTSYKLFYLIAPDGLCYCIGEPVASE